MVLLGTIGKALFLIFAGILLLRIAGRKTISQMTLPETIIIISIGTIIVEPVAQESLLGTILASSTFIVALVVTEFLQMKSNRLETFISGKAMVVIQNGQIQTDALRKLRLTVDQLELRLRQQGIANFSDIKTATIEPSRQLGYELTEDAKPLTVGEFKKLMQAYIKNEESKESSQINIFDEITEKKSTPDSLK
ncbi:MULTISPECIES: DUF421 domain-containing protein [Bacillus]|jgi:uncharacterized membrane protein YcaP (DUF421 family)|uniref:DUF421 domain-containing protein n=1 Tax=Bacillus TaxID=1386 RepID=UPI002E1BA2CE|nr:DUF421 domain-containing protein [Bacillus smithii]MED4928484.1 DUF421 domain-containing protein [Bacillus smithii]